MIDKYLFLFRHVDEITFNNLLQSLIRLKDKYENSNNHIITKLSLVKDIKELTQEGLKISKEFCDLLTDLKFIKSDLTQPYTYIITDLIYEINNYEQVKYMVVNEIDAHQVSRRNK